MSFKSTAQDQLLVVDPSALSPLEVELPMEHDNGGSDNELLVHESIPSIEVEDKPEFDIVVEDLPGAPDGTRDPEPMLEVTDPAMQLGEVDDDNDAKKSKNDKWDWASRGPHGFVAWIQEKITNVPKHSGYDSAGLERAMAYMDKVDNEISRAMRMDLDGELDANKIEEIRSKLDEGISRLQSRLDKVKESKKSSRKKKKSTAEINSEILRSFDQQDVNRWVEKVNVPGEQWTNEKALYQMAEYYNNRGMIKEAQKILGVQGIYIMAPLIIASIARICVNGTVSAGHDITDLYKRQVDRWKLSDREQFELSQLLFDMGYPIRGDRGYMPDETLDPASSDNFDYMANYKG